MQEYDVHDFPDTAELLEGKSVWLKNPFYKQNLLSPGFRFLQQFLLKYSLKPQSSTSCPFSKAGYFACKFLKEQSSLLSTFFLQIFFPCRKLTNYWRMRKCLSFILFIISLCLQQNTLQKFLSPLYSQQVPQADQVKVPCFLFLSVQSCLHLIS